MTEPIQNTPWDRPEWKDTAAPKLNAPIVPCWMTKREYFAALAMQGLLACDYDPADTAGLAVLNADALIAALEK